MRASWVKWSMFRYGGRVVKCPGGTRTSKQPPCRATKLALWLHKLPGRGHCGVGGGGGGYVGGGHGGQKWGEERCASPLGFTARMTPGGAASACLSLQQQGQPHPSHFFSLFFLLFSSRPLKPQLQVC